MEHISTLSSSACERKMFAIAVGQYLIRCGKPYSGSLPLSFYVQEEVVAMDGHEMIVCSLPGRELVFKGHSTGYGAEILEVWHSGQKDDRFDGFRSSLDPDAAAELLVAEYHPDFTLSVAVKKRIFLLVVARKFGFSLKERMSQVEDLVEERKFVFPGARMLRYHSGDLTIIGFVSAISDKENGNRVRVFFSRTLESGRYIHWACLEGIDFHPSDIEKLSLDRAVVEGWYASISRFFGQCFGLVA